MSLVFQFINNPLMEGLLFLLVAKIVLVDFEESLTVCQVKFDVTQCIIRYYPMINLTELSLMILESNCMVSAQKLTCIHILFGEYLIFLWG